MFKSHIRSSFCSFLCAVLMLSGPAHASDDIERMQQDVKKELVRVAQELARLEDAKDDAPFQRAKSILQGVDTKLDALVKAIEKKQKDLGDVRYYDKERKEYLEYERYIDAFGNIGPALATLKKAQFTLDKIPGACEKAEKEQDKLVQDLLKEEETDGPKILSEKYQKIGAQIGLDLKKAEQMKGTLTSAFDKVRGFDPNGKEWDMIEKELETSAQNIVAYWMGILRETHKQCDDLSLGVKDPDVQSAIRKLEEIKNANLSAAEKLTKAADVWRSHSRDVIRQDCKAMEEIWRAYCGSDWEPNEFVDKAAANTVAARKAREVADNSRKLLAEVPGLEKMIDDLDDKDESKKAAEAARKIIEKYKGYFDRIDKTGAPRGSAHPKMQQAIEFGKSQHKRMESSYSCDVKDEYLAGSRGRPDCIKFNECEVKIVEFKPNEAGAIRKGKEQLADYLDAAEKYYNGYYKDNKTPPLGDAHFDKQAAICRSKGHNLTYKGALGLYNMCENTYDCIEPE